MYKELRNSTLPPASRSVTRDNGCIDKKYFQFLSRVISERKLKQKPHTIIFTLKHLKNKCLVIGLQGLLVSANENHGRK